MAETKPIITTWTHRGMVFTGESPGRPPITIDGNTVEGPSPVETLLIALAGCTGSDVVLILGKKRIDLKELRIETSGTRRDEDPRRFTAIRLTFTVDAPGAKEAAVRQAIDLSFEKYCSVTHSLNPDIPVTYELVLRA